MFLFQAVVKTKKRIRTELIFVVGYLPPSAICMTDQGFYIPCEWAVVEFSMEKGTAFPQRYDTQDWTIFFT